MVDRMYCREMIDSRRRENRVRWLSKWEKITRGKIKADIDYWTVLGS